jgi:hypothetical protein
MFCSNHGNVTDLIKALLGSSSVNTFQGMRQAKIKDTVFSTWSVPTGYRRTREWEFSSVQSSVGDSHGKFLVEEELEVGL